MIERYNFLDIKLLISQQDKIKASKEELERAKKEASDFREEVVQMIQEFNSKQVLCHLNLYGMTGSSCPTNIEEGEITDSSVNFLN